MTISQLIKQLEEIKAESGNIKIFTLIMGKINRKIYYLSPELSVRKIKGILLTIE